MSDMMILNMPVAAPPKPAAHSPAPAEAPESGGASDFAAELNRQLTQVNEAAPGPGRDAGKGRETGESAPETDATDEPTQEGQSAAPGQQAGVDRLALVAQLLAAATAAGDAAPAQAGAAPGGDAAAATATAAVGSAEAATAAAAAMTMPVGAQAVPAETAAVGQQAPTQVGTGEPEVSVMPGDQAVPAAQAETVPAVGQSVTVAATGDAPTGEPTAQSAEAGPTSPATGVEAVAASKAGAQVAGTAATKQTGGPKATVGKAAADTAAPASTAEQQPAPTEVASTPTVTAKPTAKVADTADQGAAAQGKPAAKESTTAPDGRMQTNHGLTGDELASTGARPTGSAAAAAPAVSDKPALPQPVVSDVIGQMVAGAKLLRQGPVTEMRLQLKPEFLGRVDLKVTLTDGILSARILVDNPQVKAAIEANLPQLKQDLADQGIALQGMTVGLGGSHQEAADPRQSAFQRYLPQYRSGRESAPVATGIVAQRPVSASNRLDLLL